MVTTSPDRKRRLCSGSFSSKASPRLKVMKTFCNVSGSMRKIVAYSQFTSANSFRAPLTNSKNRNFLTRSGSKRNVNVPYKLVPPPPPDVPETNAFFWFQYELGIRLARSGIRSVLRIPSFQLTLLGTATCPAKVPTLSNRGEIGTTWI